MSITITMTTTEAEAVGFALYHTTRNMNDVLQGCFDHPATETNETPDERLESMWAFRQYRDAMYAVRDRLKAAKEANNAL